LAAEAFAAGNGGRDMTMDSTKQAWARGGLIFAATLMVIIGVYQFFLGIAAIVQSGIFVVGPDYVYEFDTTAWGWIHLVIGVIAAAAGFFLYMGATWARTAAIVLVVLSAIANFFFLPYYPVWSILIIALDIFAIWAISTARQPIVGETAMYGAASFPGEAPQAGGRWPAENVPAGRHWAPENVKEAAGGPMTGEPMTEEAKQRAAAAARAASEGRRGMPPTPPTTGG
jgi:hypothetical protein